VVWNSNAYLTSSVKKTWAAGTDKDMTLDYNTNRNSAFVNNMLAYATYFVGKIDYASSVVTLDGTELHLTPIEYKLLILLAKNVGKVLTHSYIIDRIWGNGIDSDIVSLRVYMAGLRKKLKQGQNASLIQTHVGIGYQMIRI
jgi:two-component system KDP operon response regulator KdpE